MMALYYEQNALPPISFFAILIVFCAASLFLGSMFGLGIFYLSYVFAGNSFEYSLLGLGFFSGSAWVFLYWCGWQFWGRKHFGEGN
jgi:hypothetical protein